MKLLIVNPNTTVSLTERIAGIARRCANRDTEIIAATAPYGAAYISSPAESADAVDAVLEVLAGHEGGFDAAVIASSSDSGLGAARRSTPRPVTAMTVAALHFACQLGARFSFICFQETGLTLMPKLAADYGLQSRLAGVRLACHLEGGAAPDADDLNRSILAAGRAAIEDDGADVLIVGGAAAADQVDEFSDSLGVPVLDGITSAVKMAEALAVIQRPG
ncbi:MAG: aspartate/glutamate racemase family protein [Rhodospirillales bacterium]|jgi:Asp/Glu/hydantoin racemase|nr:hydantoin racemase [Rhodospirillaceae bacterium]MDP6426950.1 aspartate/glutamate racemase family protein [Rhodospirillales bacterium]MDP6645348.1 aspartate/glutamate racemase family protein [Rhodospirillales bacterium]MDP6841763.1 aspartate/glutamate racemase family protein [Rhodospirillales bacterium]